MFDTILALIFRMLLSHSSISNTVVGVLMILGFSDPKVTSDISFTSSILRLSFLANASLV